MNPDVIFLLGLAVAALAVPATISAFSSSDKTLRPAVIAILIGGALVVWANSQKPGGYDLRQVPKLVVDLFG